MFYSEVLHSNEAKMRFLCPCAIHEGMHGREGISQSLVGGFANLRKPNISFIISVCLYARNNSAPTRWIFMRSDTWIFSKICRENSSFIKIWQEYRLFTWRPIHIFDHYLLSTSWYVSDKSRLNQNTHFKFNDLLFFFLENRTVYEKMWKMFVGPDRPHMTIWS